MKRLFFIMALCLCASLSVQAQNKHTITSSAVPTPNYFVGTIDYMVKMNPTATQTAPVKRANMDPWTEPNAPKEQEGAGFVPFLAVDKEASLFNVGRLNFFSYKDQTNISVSEGNVLSQSVIEPCILYPNCKMLTKMMDAYNRGEMEEYAKYFKEVYHRTEETRVIAGEKCVKYLANLERMEGEIWVAEHIDLKQCMMPYMGLFHPVLECELRLPIEGIEPFFMTATRVVKDEKVSAKDSMGKFDTQEERPLEELLNMIRKYGFKN